LDGRLSSVGKLECQATGSSEPIVPRVEFVLVVEAGGLEQQATLLCESIRLHAGRYRQAPIVAVSPDPERRPSRGFESFAERHAVEYQAFSLTVECAAYRPANRIFAGAERACRSTADILIVCDSDTLFLREPDFSLDGMDVAVRPVDVKGICPWGADDPFASYWRSLCRLAGVDYERLPCVVPTVEERPVKASYNAGLVVVRRDTGILQKTAELFGRGVRAGLRPRTIGQERVTASTGFVGEIASAYWGTSQAALSLAIWSSTDRVRTLPPTYNVPLHIWEALLAQHPALPLHDLIHVHYHWLGRPGFEAANPLLDGRLPLTANANEWIGARMPFAANTSPGPGSPGRAR
jgi:hypothetical protein